MSQKRNKAKVRVHDHADDRKEKKKKPDLSSRFFSYRISGIIDGKTR